MRCITILLFLVGTIVYGQRSDFEHIDFTKADSIAAHYSGASLKNLPVLTHNLTANLPTDVEKFRAIYTWVGTNIENDYSSYVKTRKKRKKLSENQEALTAWNNSFTPKVFENLLKHKKTACTGYAYLIRELASLADINCKIVNGYGRTATLILDENSIPNHSWNIVELNGKWYLCDPTWSAGKIVIEEDGPRFEPDYFDGYFLAEPELFIRNHYPLEISASLLENPPTFEEFIEGPVVYKEAFGASIFPIVPKKMYLEIVKNESVSFKLTSAQPIEKENTFLLLNTGGSSKEHQPKITRNGNATILQHTFDKAGRYDVHIKVNDTIIATYVIKVKRK
ncbi:transglutaminase domain-containing protein [Maribacter sp. 2308TA10-17]|uniref:transglutaminase domain-containing protein n=1 Tax=Maribacter sp. 2308TA10-17 TaxID=3386276 RepID=UPI0039BC46A0